MNKHRQNRQTRNHKRNKRRLTRKRGGGNINSKIYNDILKAVKDGNLSELQKIITTIESSNIKEGLTKVREYVNKIDPEGDRKTPLLYAIESKSPNSISIVKTLISYGADITKKDLQFGDSPLYIAITQTPNAPPVQNTNKPKYEELKAMSTEKVKILLEAAFGNAMNELSNTTYANNSQMINEAKDILAEFVNERNNEVGGLQTPLMQAARTGNMEVVKILLRAGANLLDKDKFQVDATFYAKMNKYAKKDVYEMLNDIKKSIPLGTEAYLAALEKHDLIPPEPSQNNGNTGTGAVGAGAGE